MLGYDRGRSDLEKAGATFHAATGWLRAGSRMRGSAWRGVGEKVARGRGLCMAGDFRTRCILHDAASILFVSSHGAVPWGRSAASFQRCGSGPDSTIELGKLFMRDGSPEGYS